MKTEFEPIGIIHTPFREKEGMPIQPAGAQGIAGTVEVFEKFQAGLKDLDGFSHIILLYQFHASKGYRLEVVPFMDDRTHGVFATRAPRRPNPIGLSVVRLTGVKGNILEVENVDILDGTPLLDIKPHVSSFDAAEDIRTGWLKDPGTRASTHESDDRFKQEDSG